MVAPDADHPGVVQEPDGLFEAASQLEHIAEDDEAVGPMLLQDRQGPPQFVLLLVDIGQDANPHGDAISSPRADRPQANEDPT